jgi:hypothetical protein
MTRLPAATIWSQPVLCIANATHEASIREFMHPQWSSIVRAVFCPVCGRAWFVGRTNDGGEAVELNLKRWEPAERMLAK